ncbi:DUF7096 domain-containing protein [Natrinema salaciae]|uniref:DUF7096 domain-containing protein n=1 Tax=Natrinema salaciae TaxID=1186196 RepID=A0A1H9FNF0_9EURY|nr:hypothetical protein [Natrinema salaciae]SEQ39414.1 hypothetical protein SAMN04489841_1631 [Natrinema salaciae]
MKRITIGSLLFAVLVVGMTVPPAVAVDTGTASSVGSGQAAGMVVQENGTQSGSGSNVNVTVGQQLSTVIDVSSDEVRTDFENTAFEVSIESDSEEERVEAVAERAETLRERAEDIREEYDEATEEYEAGDISRSEYAQRLATLNARAANVADSNEQLQRRAANVSALELQAAGVNQSALDEAVNDLSSVSGSGTTALLERFTGESRGEIELETAGGLSIEVASEDGERSREVERTRDGDRSITVSQSAALETAQAALSTPENGTWEHSESSVKEDEGAYEFEFALRNAAGQTGEAEVRIDGSTGEVYKLEEEIEAEDEADDEREDDREDEREDEADDEREDDREDDEREDKRDDADAIRNLSVETTLEGETATAVVNYDGSAVANATVSANDRVVGTTNADGTVTFIFDVRETDELELDVRKGEFEAELEYEVRDGSLTLTEDAHESEDETEPVDDGDEEPDDDDETETESVDDGDEEPDDDDETETESEVEDT